MAYRHSSVTYRDSVVERGGLSDHGLMALATKQAQSTNPRLCLKRRLMLLFLVASPHFGFPFGKVANDKLD